MAEWYECTYTKHKTQKRKVWHDGKLKVLPSRKALLYAVDGSGEMRPMAIDSKFLPTDVAIETGEILEFDLYLVDIGDADIGDTGSKSPSIANEPTTANEPTVGRASVPHGSILPRKRPVTLQPRAGLRRRVGLTRPRNIETPLPEPAVSAGASTVYAVPQSGADPEFHTPLTAPPTDFFESIPRANTFHLSPAATPSNPPVGQRDQQATSTPASTVSAADLLSLFMEEPPQHTPNRADSVSAIHSLSHEEQNLSSLEGPAIHGREPSITIKASPSFESSKLFQTPSKAISLEQPNQSRATMPSLSTFAAQKSLNRSGSAVARPLIDVAFSQLKGETCLVVNG